MRELFARIQDLVSRPVPAGRLGDFSLSGRHGPVLALLATLLAFYVLGASATAIVVLLKLWTAYAVAYLGLAVLAKLKGVNAPWLYILPVAGAGVGLGGLGAAIVAFAPEWTALAVLSRVGPEWAIGAAFSAFFVGLSLVTSAVRDRERREAETRRQLLEARLETLTAQIEPHFLINTLANLRYLIRTEPGKAHALLDHIADFLQSALERTREPHSTLGTELTLIENYLAIMEIRLGERLRYQVDVSADLKDVPFPPLLLQTLVENAVKHGAEPADGSCTVTITASRNGAGVEVLVKDDGVGIGAGITEGMGLQNARARLETIFGAHASLTLSPGASKGTCAKVRVPIPAA